MIESKDNPKIKKYFKLLHKKSCRDDLNRFTLEGVRVLKDALESGIVFDDVFITKSCISKIRHTEYDISNLCEYDVISDKVAKHISGVDRSQGAFAIASKPPGILAQDISNSDFVLALCFIQDPGNLGTLIRTADAFGFSKIVLSGCCDIYNPKVVRSTAGSLFRVSFLECFDFLSFLEDVDLKKYAAVVDEAALPISELDLKGEGAVLVIGNEANGLPSEIVKECDKKITIDMSGAANSLNAAVAGAVCMYKFREVRKRGF